MTPGSILSASRRCGQGPAHVASAPSRREKVAAASRRRALLFRPSCTSACGGRQQRRSIMRKVVAGAFLSLDGIMQAPGGPDEDPTGGFKHGGWTAPYWNDAIAAATGDSFSAPFDLL